MHKLVTIALLLLLLFFAPAYAADSSSQITVPPWYNAVQCSEDRAVEATNAADKLENWDAVYDWFKHFKHCDYHSGEMGESLDDGIAKLLANDWQHFPRLALLSRKTKLFGSFVLSYIGPTAGSADLKIAAQNAHEHCPAKARGLCAAIEKKIGEAQSEANDDSK